MKSLLLFLSVVWTARLPNRHQERLNYLIEQQRQGNISSIHSDRALRLRVQHDERKIQKMEAVINNLQKQFNIIRHELSGIPSQSALYSKINIMSDTIAGVSDVVEERVTKLDTEVKQVEKASKHTKQKMEELSRKVRIESQKRAMVADSLHGQESVLDLTRRRHFAMIVQLKRKIKLLESELTEHYGAPLER